MERGKQEHLDGIILVSGSLLLILYIVIKLFHGSGGVWETLIGTIGTVTFILLLSHAWYQEDVLRMFALMYLGAAVLVFCLVDPTDCEVLLGWLCSVGTQIFLIQAVADESRRTSMTVIGSGLLMVLIAFGSTGIRLSILIPVAASGVSFACALHTNASISERLQVQRMSMICCISIALVPIGIGFYNEEFVCRLFTYLGPVFLILLPLMLDRLYDTLKSFFNDCDRTAVAGSYFIICFLMYGLLSLTYMWLDIENSPVEWLYLCLICGMIYILNNMNRKRQSRRTVFQYLKDTVVSAVFLIFFVVSSGLILFLTSNRLRTVLFHIGLKPYGILKISREDWVGNRLAGFRYFFGDTQMYEELVTERFNGILDCIKFWYKTDMAVQGSRWLLLLTIVLWGIIVAALAMKKVQDTELRRRKTLLLIGYSMRVIIHVLLTMGMYGPYFRKTIEEGVLFAAVEFTILLLFLSACRWKQEDCEKHDIIYEETAESEEYGGITKRFAVFMILICITSVISIHTFHIVNDLDETQWYMEEETDVSEQKMYSELEVVEQREEGKVSCQYLFDNRLAYETVIYCEEIIDKWILNDDAFVLYLVKEQDKTLRMIGVDLRFWNSNRLIDFGMEEIADVEILQTECRKDRLWIYLLADTEESVFYIDRKKEYAEFVTGEPGIDEDLVPDWVNSYLEEKEKEDVEERTRKIAIEALGWLIDPETENQ